MTKLMELVLLFVQRHLLDYEIKLYSADGAWRASVGFREDKCQGCSNTKLGKYLINLAG